MPIGSFIKLARTAAIVVALALSAPMTQAKDVKTKPGKAPAFNASACYGCHAPIKAFHADGKHRSIGCNS